MKVLVLGCGLQGRAVLFDLARCPLVHSVTCADANVDRASAYVSQLRTDKLEAVHLDATDDAALQDLVGGGFDVVIDMLPRPCAAAVGGAAVAAGVHLVNTCYTNALGNAGTRAAEAGIAVLPEMGFDPGIDLVLAAEAVRRFDRVHRLDSYGGGIPEPGADDNPLRYKISWIWEGVLASYVRPARLVLDGRIVEVPGTEIFEADHIHTIDVEPFGRLEAFPNGDAASYARKFGIEAFARNVGRYALRWPGHAEIWHVFASMGFLDETPVRSLHDITPRQFMRDHLEPRLQYGPDERDMVIIRVVAEGEGYRSPRLTFELVDHRDAESGLMAMNRTVGFPASIAAQMIVNGVITDRGLLSPTKHVPFEPFVAALQERGIQIREIEG